MERRLLALVPRVNRVGAGAQQALDHLGQALGRREVEAGLLSLLIDVERGVAASKPNQNSVTSVDARILGIPGYMDIAGRQ